MHATTHTKEGPKGRRVEATMTGAGRKSAAIRPASLESTERTTQHLAIDANLHRALKVKAADQKKTLRELVEPTLHKLLSH